MFCIHLWVSFPFLCVRSSPSTWFLLIADGQTAGANLTFLWPSSNAGPTLWRQCRQGLSYLHTTCRNTADSPCLTLLSLVTVYTCENTRARAKEWMHSKSGHLSDKLKGLAISKRFVCFVYFSFPRCACGTVWGTNNIQISCRQQPTLGFGSKGFNLRVIFSLPLSISRTLFPQRDLVLSKAPMETFN